MVRGLEKFKEYFAGFEDNYVIIGGTACDIALREHPDILGEQTGFHLTSIPIGEDISSLSAILLDEEYYNQTIEGSIIEEGIRIANPLSLICLKAKAFLNLTEEKKINPNVRSSDIKKHRDDIFKLLAMRIDPFTPVELPGKMRENMNVFINMIEQSLPNQSLQDSLQRTNDDIRGYMDIMREIFGLIQP